MTLMRIGLLVSLAVFCLVIYLLMTGSSLLTYPLSESLGLPLGTLITWLGFLSFPGILYFGFPALRTPRSRIHRFLRTAWWIGLALALAWPFISFYLAANWSFSFRLQEAFRGSDRASYYFWHLCTATVVWPLLVLFALVLDHLLGGARKG